MAEQPICHPWLSVCNPSAYTQRCYSRLCILSASSLSVNGLSSSHRFLHYITKPVCAAFSYALPVLTDNSQTVSSQHSYPPCTPFVVDRQCNPYILRLLNTLRLGGRRRHTRARFHCFFALHSL